MDNFETATCVNGELKPGDLVLSSPTNDYAGLVGTVIYIEKVGTPEHGTENPGDDIHVDFTEADYSKKRFVEIGLMLGDLYGRPTTPGIWPPIDVDDAIMAPEMLIRITDIEHEKLTEILDSGTAAASFFNSVAEGRTAAQAALLEPEAVNTAELRGILFSRLDDNLIGYFETLRGRDAGEIPGMSSEISAMAGTHCYLSEIHNFHYSELEYLLKFENPLSVVADEVQNADINDHSDIMWKIFDRQEALHGDYSLVQPPTDETVIRQNLYQRLNYSLAGNMKLYRETMISSALTDDEIIELAEKITSLKSAHDVLTNQFEFTDSELATLMRLDYPLDGIAAHWDDIVDCVDVEEGISDLLQYSETITDRPLITPHAQEAMYRHDTSKKPSVLAQLREAEKEPKPRPIAKDKQDKSGPEL